VRITAELAAADNMLYILEGNIVLGNMNLASSVANRINAQFRETLRSLGNWNATTYKNPFSITATNDGSYIVGFNVIYTDEDGAIRDANWIKTLFPWVVKDDEADTEIKVSEFDNGQLGEVKLEVQKEWVDPVEPPEQPDEWIQPTGAHDAYSTDDKVLFRKEQWESLIDGNVWAPNVTGWRKVVDEGNGEVAPWQQPLGAHDAYPLGAVVSHKGSNWESNVADNVWEPGVFGWNSL